MFNRILIANRGAIATRIIRTLKEMGIQSVAVYAEADAHSLHVQLADQAYSLGEGPASDTYLNTEKLFDVIRQSKAEAVHPGYGFLSENAEFVEACQQQGIEFIGPRPEHMRMFGLKHEARRLAQENGVPLLPGSTLLTSIDSAVEEAAKLSYPVMLKSTAGGGGIGMQVCRSADELKQCFDSIKRLSANNFANDGVFVEKYIEFARHIEVQVFGDGEGKAVAFGERDCSAQRRHQKVIEETPAPNIPNAVREQLQHTATKLLSAVAYRNAGTVEFIYDQNSDDFYFLEVNTRLQVEHGVTEEVFGLDLVEWMIQLAAKELGDIEALRSAYRSTGHSIQARIYAEDPNLNFQPSAGLLSQVEFPAKNATTRIDHWVETGLEVSPFFDPMLAKVICKGETREQAIDALKTVLKDITLQGIECNIDYLLCLLETDTLNEGKLFTRFLNDFEFTPLSIDVVSGGTLTTIQDYPGRIGYWDVGVPPSGPFDNLSFRLANRLLGNTRCAAGLEITLQGPTLKFNCDSAFALGGAEFVAHLNNSEICFNKVHCVKRGDVLKIGKPKSEGARAYLAVAGGIEGNNYLGSQSTFSLGKFGGFSGRALRTGDVLHLASNKQALPEADLPTELIPEITTNWQLRVTYGPHGAPDFFTDQDIKTFFSSTWEVHYNSSRTGIRLIGPKPEWARETGGEAGMHPSNIHDNAYAIGTVDFTGDMPVILGPDGPSLGGFVCPATVIHADLWKLGQLKAGDKIQFTPVTQACAEALEKHQSAQLERFSPQQLPEIEQVDFANSSPILQRIAASEDSPQVVYRQAGDKYLLVEYGPQELDIRLRFRVHALMLALQKAEHKALLELTPGIRSLQVHYDNLALPREQLLELLVATEATLSNIDDLAIPSRTVYLPLSWDDEACKLAVQKYMQSVRADAPWCPDNIEFIRRINGLGSVTDVMNIVFDASYVVMGLGDVYLGAPVATPLDPRKRLVTTKYNPARTWTAENSVGIGGAYLCVYGMEGPGGYQFVGRTLQMWNKYHITKEFSKPWLLRFFDQIRFYPVSAEELKDIRKKFPRGDYPLRIEEGEFRLSDYDTFIEQNSASINAFVSKQQKAFDEELKRWQESGQINFDSSNIVEAETSENAIADNCTTIESPAAGSIWQWQVDSEQQVKENDLIGILESMKMEIEILAPCDGTISEIKKQVGQQVHAGQVLGVIEND
ncbi:urea carboxylase [Alteromonadaceae bacterium Bs31]|nr:urea carboxylase [Alteromonadaceae bacterium Bs31]